MSASAIYLSHTTHTVSPTSKFSTIYFHTRSVYYNTLISHSPSTFLLSTINSNLWYSELTRSFVKYTYVLKIVYVRHFKTKVERQCVIRCRHDGHILNQVRVFVFDVIKTYCTVYYSKYNGSLG